MKTCLDLVREFVRKISKTISMHKDNVADSLKAQTPAKRSAGFDAVKFAIKLIGYLGKALMEYTESSINLLFMEIPPITINLIYMMLVLVIPPITTNLAYTMLVL